MTRRRLLLAASAVVAVGAALPLSLAAAATAWYDLGAAVLLALAAVAVIQPLYVIARRPKDRT